MPTYAIGDVQGCYAQLAQLLEQIHFDDKQDTLWFVGDLVNRGPQSLEVLRFVKALGDRQKTVLGNHDLNLLAIALADRPIHEHDTLDAILTAPDKLELLEWLRHRPLLIYDHELQYVMTHAGIAPAWDLSKAQQLAQEVESVLQSDQAKLFLQNMYGSQPDIWRDDLSGMDRLRCITNYFTRMRFCDADGRLDLAYKGTIQKKPPELIPWFEVKPRAAEKIKIVFGHWAALEGKTSVANIFALDTGCVWGKCLTAFRLQDQKRFRAQC